MKHNCVIVTGASRGIGAAVAIALAETGITVGCLSRSGQNPCPSDADESLKQRFIALACDVTDREALADAVQKVAEITHCDISGIVNNAGLHTSGPSEDLAADDFRQLMDINALAVLQGCQVAYPWMLKAGHGLIINMGSFYDRLGIKHNLAYCASKAAVGAITRCLAVEWAQKNIRVLNIAPGYIVTDLNREAMEHGPLAAFLAKRIPRGAPGQPHEIGQLVAHLFALNSAFMTGETIYIDGAQSLTD
jgi:NAD(P)-dependent dehydrogenase (short-subunit alcohol dehydrogenase family)